MSESMIVGVDHGYAAMKTAHFSFPSGLVAYEHEPYTLKDVLEYGGKFYVVGSGRQALQKNKTQTEDYYLLTLAAIGRFMRQETDWNAIWEMRNTGNRQRSIWRPDCPSPALDGRKTHSGTICSEMGKR